MFLPTSWVLSSDDGVSFCLLCALQSHKAHCFNQWERENFIIIFDNLREIGEEEISNFGTSLVYLKYNKMKFHAKKTYAH